MASSGNEEEEGGEFTPFIEKGTGSEQHLSDSTKQKLEKYRWRTSSLLYLGYIALVLCRNDLNTVLPALHISHQECGELLFWGNLAYFFGKLTTGSLADRLGGNTTYILAIGCTVLLTFFLSFSNSLTYLSIVLGLRRFVQSAAWPAMLQVVCSWFVPSQYNTVTAFLFTAPRVGVGVATTLLGSLAYVYHFTWSHILITAACIASLLTLAVAASLKPNPESVGLPPLPTPPSSPSELTDPNSAAAGGRRGRGAPLTPPSLYQTYCRFLRSPRFWLISIAQLSMTLLMEFEYFIPLFLKEQFAYHGGIASALSAVFTLGCVLSLISGGPLLDRVSRYTGAGLVLLSLLTTVAACSWLYLMGHGALPMQLPAVLSALFLLGFSLSVPFYIPQSLFALQFGGKDGCATVIATVDAIGFLSAVAFDRTCGVLAMRYGWGYVFSLMLASALCAVLSMAAFLVLDVGAARADEVARILAVRKLAGTAIGGRDPANDEPDRSAQLL